MKIVAEVVAAIVLLASGAFFAPSLVKQFKVETIQKVDRGLPSLQRFTKELTKIKK